jgi:hypothetical protein
MFKKVEPQMNADFSHLRSLRRVSKQCLSVQSTAHEDSRRVAATSPTVRQGKPVEGLDRKVYRLANASQAQLLGAMATHKMLGRYFVQFG